MQSKTEAPRLISMDEEVKHVYAIVECIQGGRSAMTRFGGLDAVDNDFLIATAIVTYANSRIEEVLATKGLNNAKV